MLLFQGWSSCVLTEGNMPIVVGVEVSKDLVALLTRHAEAKTLCKLEKLPPAEMRVNEPPPPGQQPSGSASGKGKLRTC